MPSTTSLVKKNLLILFPFELNALAEPIIAKMPDQVGCMTLRSFPDEESYVRMDSDLKNKKVFFIANLNQPNCKILPLLFAAKTAKANGALNVNLIAPYLPYMRQDIAFQKGEAISAAYFAEVITNDFDSLATIDPHLHRYHHLNEVYSIKTTVLHATDLIAQWIMNHVVNPLLIGPDQESEQWIKKIANRLHAPYVILQKIRRGDREVEVTLPNLQLFKQCTPILVDDIIATACTMIATIKELNVLNMPRPICIGVHALFVDESYQQLLQAGASQVVTCNSIAHVSNQIDLSPLIIDLLHREL